MTKRNLNLAGCLPNGITDNFRTPCHGIKFSKEVVTELIQTKFNTKQLKKELTHILEEYNRAVLFLEYYDLEQKLGGIGASEKTAKLIFESLRKA